MDSIPSPIFLRARFAKTEPQRTQSIKQIPNFKSQNPHFKCASTLNASLAVIASDQGERGNLHTFIILYEIASVVILPRNDIMTQPLRGEG